MFLASFSACSADGPVRPLGEVTFGDAFLGTRKALPGFDPFDEPIVPGPTGLIALTLEPPNTETCLPPLEKGRLRATANGKPMALDAAAGSHTEYHTGSDHFPKRQRVCDPLRFTLPREDIPPGEGGVATFEVTDGRTTIKLAWSHPFDERVATPVDHDLTLTPGEHLRLRWSPADDEFSPGPHVLACLQTGPDATTCPRSPNGSQCTPAHVAAGNVSFDVPASWSCAPGGGLWVSGLNQRAHSTLCDAHLRECRADLVPAVKPLDVRIAH